jgi:large conductance mechanosensitive channel
MPAQFVSSFINPLLARNQAASARDCPECTMSIPVAAKRCPECTAQITPGTEQPQTIS